MASVKPQCEACGCDVTGEECRGKWWKCGCGRQVCSAHISWTKGSGRYEICYHCEQMDDDGECYCDENDADESAE